MSLETRLSEDRLAHWLLGVVGTASTVRSAQKTVERCVENTLQLHRKLDEMQLHDNTGDPHDEGYMAAVNEVREWLERARG